MKEKVDIGIRVERSKCFLSLFILVIICLVPGITIATVMEVKLGQSTVLECPYRSTSNPLLWLGPPNLVGYTNNAEINTRIEKHNRLRIIGEETNGEYNLQILNVTRSDEGTYQCATVERRGTVSFRFYLRIFRKPEILTKQHVNKILANIGIISNVSFFIDCFPQPSASWIQTAGGKVGTWNIEEISSSNFKLSSTVLPAKPSDLGEYIVLIRNAEGSLEIKILLPVHEPSIDISPTTYCNTSRQFNLTCSMDNNDNKTWLNEWSHFRNTVLIRSMNSSIKDGISVLRITYCDYQDEGEYVCTWKNGDREISSSTSVIVYGMPVITSKDVSRKEGYFELSVLFFTSSLPFSVHWLRNDLLLVVNTTSLAESAHVSILCYEKKVLTKGYRIHLLLNDSYNYVDVMSCQLQNDYGTAEAIFHPKLLSSFQKETAFHYETTRDNLATTNFYRPLTEIFSINGKNVFPQYLYHTISGVIITVLVIIVLIVIAKNARLIKIVEMNKVGANSRPPSSQSVSTDTGNDAIPVESHYDEIDNTSYQSVTWRTYDLHTEERETPSESNENESVKTIRHDYLDLQEISSEPNAFVLGSHQNDEN